MRSFERIVRIREIWEKQSRIQLGAANRELIEAAAEAERASDAHRRSVAATPESGPSTQLELWRLAAMATHERYNGAAQIRGQAEDHAKAAQGAWRRSSQQVDMARSIEDRRKQALAYAARRSSEATLDELMALRRKRR